MMKGSIKLLWIAVFFSTVFISCKEKVISGEQTIILKPGGDIGKDAQVWSYDPEGDLDRGTDRTDIVAYEWTKDGFPTTKYGLIEFDLSAMQFTEIIEARLLLFHDANSTDQIHSQLSGSNEMLLQRVTSPWVESVSWNTRPSTTSQSEMLIVASPSSTTDYDMIVTNLVQDMVDDPENSFGFQFKIATEEYYRSVGFASSEHPNADLHPELRVTFKVRP